MNTPLKKNVALSALKVPPHDLELEQSVLGSLIIDRKAIYKIADTIDEKDFYDRRNQHIFHAILKLYEKETPIDIISLAAKLREHKTLDEVGGNAYLSELVNKVSSSVHIEHYAKIVKEKRIMRDLIDASRRIEESAFEGGQDMELDEFLDNVEKRVFEITQLSIYREFTGIKDDLSEAFQRIERMQESGNKIRGVATGFDQLDKILSGFQKSDFVILGARPSVGKTSLALDIARHAALRQKTPVGIFSLEMSREQVVDRILAAESRVSLWKIRGGERFDDGDTDYELIGDTIDKLSEAPIFIDDMASPNIMQIRAMSRRLQSVQGLGLLIVDYLQLIQPRNSRDQMVQQITEISRALKSLARELNVPVLALSQLSRAVEQRGNEPPRLSDLRESGSLEQDADVVMFIHAKNRRNETISEEERTLTDIIVAKHRNGPLGTVTLKFDGRRASFVPVETHHQEKEYSF